MTFKGSGVRLGNQRINHLLFADDLVLLSNTPEELQADLDNLSRYCDNNNLTVSVEKTKCLPFYRGRFDNIPIFFYKQDCIENVKEFKYLGIVFTTQLSASKHLKSVISKCNSRIGQLFYKLKIDHATLELALKIFQTYITPVIEYGLPVWLPKVSRSAQGKLDSLFTKYLKRFLCIPYSIENSLVHHITQTAPLSDYLHHVHPRRFLSMSFPSGLQGIQFPIPPDKTPPIPPLIEELPQYYRDAPTSVQAIPLEPSNKRMLLYDKLDIIHYHLCKNSSFHSTSMVGLDEGCSCKFCGKRAVHFHHRNCSILKVLSMKGVMVKTGCPL